MKLLETINYLGWELYIYEEENGVFTGINSDLHFRTTNFYRTEVARLFREFVDNGRQNQKYYDVPLDYLECYSDYTLRIKSTDVDWCVGTCEEDPNIYLGGTEEKIIDDFKKIIDKKNNILNYRGFRLQVTLNLEDVTVVGKILKNEHNLDLNDDYLISDCFADVKAAFEEEVDRFWFRETISENSYKYKGVTIEIEKDGESWFQGRIKDFPIDLLRGRAAEYIFQDETADDIKEMFENYVDNLERCTKIFNHLTGKTK